MVSVLESYEKQKSFVENASHELRTPLAVLQNRLESLFRKPNSTILDNSETYGKFRRGSEYALANNESFKSC